MNNLEPDYLTEKNLWDTEDLELKYPDRFERRNIEHYKGVDNKFYKK